MDNSYSKLGARFVAAVMMCTLTAAVRMTPAVAAAPAVPPGTATALPEAPERELVARACTACHAPEVVIAKRHSVEEWDDIIAKMVDRGAVASEEEQQQILEYLARYFGRDAMTKQNECCDRM